MLIDEFIAESMKRESIELNPDHLRLIRYWAIGEISNTKQENLAEIQKLCLGIVKYINNLENELINKEYVRT